MGRDRHAKQSLGSLHARIKQARVLMVGAGGIGCELLKNLILTGFGEIHVVDLDTIDLSNLNRQFLFRHEHIKKPKALVAKESAGRFNPHVKIEAYHANIKDAQFSIDWYKSFSIVFNALDNVDARRYVNKMCIAADVPLVESGTTGFLGQVQVIKRGITECYDCTPKEAPKSYPVCTIRSTPSQPIHCIVWSKSYLFTEIFGISEEQVPELDFTEDSENSGEIENLRREAEALKRIRDSMGSKDFARLVFNKVFEEDILRLRGMEEMWKNRRAPEPLNFDDLSREMVGSTSGIEKQEQAVWTVVENFAVFLGSLQRLSDRMAELKANTSVGNDSAPPILSFDKDDPDTLDFVASSANLRSHIFGIEMRSKFDIKQMAGNIIPAIATTNAIVAGLCVLQAFKVMRNQLHKAPMVFTTRGTERVMTAEKQLRPPQQGCPVCGVARATILMDPSRATLGHLVEDVLRGDLGYGEEISVITEAGVVYEPDLEDNLTKKLSELDLKSDSFITIQDENDNNPKSDLVLAMLERALPKQDKPVQLAETPHIAPKVMAILDGPKTTAKGEISTNGSAEKRKRTAADAGLEDELVRKRGKVPEQASASDDVVIVDDTHGGAILIDD